MIGNGAADFGQPAEHVALLGPNHLIPFPVQ